MLAGRNHEASKGLGVNISVVVAEGLHQGRVSGLFECSLKEEMTFFVL